jgi:xylose isomerase
MFTDIPEIRYEGIKSSNPLSFRYYDKERIVSGRKMKDWLKFSG